MAIDRSSRQDVLTWEDDPGPPNEPSRPVARPVPALTVRPLPLVIADREPGGGDRPGTRSFRYWAAAEGLRRGADFWGALLPPRITWQRSNGRQLPVRLDAGEDLNAYYDRNGLHFFHGHVAGEIVYSGESPNVTCHELGHAVLDALRPQLWDVAAIEAAAFHESFGDISAILAALQLPSFREAVLVETSGRLYRSSRLSRLAEQLGWAIRQSRPDLVDPDCLRNAVNAFFYRDPAGLPPDAPAGSLSSEPHSFSRVFTAGFFQSLAGMYALGDHGESALGAVSRDAGALLVDAVRSSPIVPAYFSQVAAHLLAADARLFARRYRSALQSGFVRHGVLSPGGAMAVGLDGAEDATAPAGRLPRVRLNGGPLGLGEDLLVEAPAQPLRFAVTGAAPDRGGVEPHSHDLAAAHFVEDLLRRGKIDLTTVDVGAAIVSPLTRKTHELRRDPAGVVLARRLFDCGFCVE